MNDKLHLFGKQTFRIVFLIAVPELMAKAKSIAAKTNDPIGSYLAAAVVYLAGVYILDTFLRWLERTTRIPGFDMERKRRTQF